MRKHRIWGRYVEKNSKVEPWASRAFPTLTEHGLLKNIHTAPDTLQPNWAVILSVFLLFQKELHLPCASCLHFTFKHMLLTALRNLWHPYFPLSVFLPCSVTFFLPPGKGPWGHGSGLSENNFSRFPYSTQPRNSPWHQS